MTDFFALLDQPRRPWLDPEALKSKFLALSAQTHPDRVHTSDETEKRSAQQRYAELNAAYNCLRNPKERLAHLLGLELGARPKDLQQMPDDLAELFIRVAQLCRQVDAFLTEKTRATSPLLRVQFFERGQEWEEKLGALQTLLVTRSEALTEMLKALDDRWNEARPNGTERRELLARLEEVYRLLSFFTRWTDQIRERLIQLAA